MLTRNMWLDNRVWNGPPGLDVVKQIEPGRHEKATRLNPCGKGVRCSARQGLQRLEGPAGIVDGTLTGGGVLVEHDVLLQHPVAVEAHLVQ